MTDEDFEGKNLVDLLEMLEPVPEPRAMSLWPATEAWIWLGLVVLALIAWGLLQWRRHHRANAYRRAALAELAQAGDDPTSIASILRRTALSAYPRVDVAGLTGDAWLAFLDAQSGTQAFVGPQGHGMLAAPYTDSRAPIRGLGDMARDWVRRHKVARQK